MTKIQRFILHLSAVLALGLVACEPQNGGTTTTDPAATDPAVTAPTETPDAPVTPKTTAPETTTP